MMSRCPGRSPSRTPSRHPGLGRRLAPWCSGLLCIVAAAAAAAASFKLPPLNRPATGQQHPGAVIWADLVTPDLAAAKRFYGGLFGWTFDDIHTGRTDYAIALLGGEPVAGIVERPMRAGTRRQPAWLTFFAAPDARRAEQAILAHGGSVLSPLRDYPRRGWQAVFRDPQGAAFAILQSSSGDPPDALAPLSGWIWSALITRDPGTDAAFYQDVFGYEVFELPEDGSDADHLILSSDRFARASVNAFPAHRAASAPASGSGSKQRPGRAPGRRPHWIDFVRVVSAADAAARASSLGGRVLVAPHRGRSGNDVAVLADPSGAPFGVLEWKGTNVKEAK